MSFRKKIEADINLHDILDTDLPQSNRIEGQRWKLKYYEAVEELRKANKGIARLRGKLDRLMKATND